MRLAGWLTMPTKGANFGAASEIVDIVDASIVSRVDGVHK